MPVEKNMLDAMLGSFRTMMQECRDKNLSGPDVEAMTATLERMETLGREMGDAGAFSGQLMQEGLFMRFSDHYGKALAAAAQQQYAAPAGEYDAAADNQLLQQTLQAYKDAALRLHENKAKTRELMGAHASDADVLLHDKAIHEALNQLIQLGESGISYPAFLSEMLRQELDKMLEGSAISRKSQEYIWEAAKATAASPFYMQQEEEKLALFDELAAAAGMEAPPLKAYTLGCEKIHWQYAPAINRWNKQKEGWEKAAFWLDEWITAYCDFAPYIEPWAAHPNPKAAVEESQHCVPGKLRVWEKINLRYFGCSLRELFNHASFHWNVEYGWMYWSQEYMQFMLNEVEPLCRPFQHPSAALIETAAAFHKEKRKVNPALGEPAARYAAYFNRYFGEGEYEKRFGLPPRVETHARPWQL